MNYPICKVIFSGIHRACLFNKFEIMCLSSVINRFNNRLVDNNTTPRNIADVTKGAIR